MKISNYHHVVYDHDLYPQHCFILSTRTSSIIKIKNDYWEAFQRNQLEHIPEDIVKKAIEIELLVNDDCDELLDILSENIAETLDKDRTRLSYTIQPSAYCQLGCHYCGQQHVKKSMDQSVYFKIYERLEAKVRENKELKHLHINWYGGEPLTGLSSIRELSPMIISLCKELKIEYTAHIVTNALNLKFDLFQELVRDHLIKSYQITIDGDEEFHDKRRMLKNNGPSFAIIYNNVKNIALSQFYEDSKANINIRCNVDSENKDNVFSFIDKLYDDKILNKVGFYVSPVHDWGDLKASQVHGISKSDFADFEIDVFLKLLEYGALNKGKIIPGRTTTPCMVVSSTSEVIDAYGNIATCWEIPYTPHYDNSDYYSGNILKDKNVDSSTASMRNWFNEIPTNSSWCKTCKFLPMCGGACPKNWKEGTPACPSFKFNIEDRVFLKYYDSIR
ncbi:SPASM domain-containing protein [Sphingobacterium daejeonense]|uniref:radical SAM/SPASM domain-containing protein n=1 Tax=Sphingobacterium daejeonense TaxID=371142 RepID=UPI0021A4143D|nr:radical SAM protein [Sphingobacterium daejeonense]MCT1531334.1 SPASM domain-containing protein [Sphingobacterium daejeonense]